MISEKTNYKIEQTFMFEFEQQQIDYFMSDALDSGIGYWCGEATPFRDGKYLPTDQWPEGSQWASDTLTRGCDLRLRVRDEEGEDEFVVLTIDKLLKGIKQAATHRNMTVKRFIDDYDADSCDIAVQFAVFDELVYG